MKPIKSDPEIEKQIRQIEININKLKQLLRAHLTKKESK